MTGRALDRFESADTAGLQPEHIARRPNPMLQARYEFVSLPVLHAKIPELVVKLVTPLLQVDDLLGGLDRCRHVRSVEWVPR